MRVFSYVALILLICSCNSSARQATPALSTAMPRPWKVIRAEEYSIPFKGVHFDPVILNDSATLAGWISWMGIDSNYNAVFHPETETLIASFRADNDGFQRYSLWQHPGNQNFSIRHEDLSGYAINTNRKPASIIIYKIPKISKPVTVAEQ